jgi:hypothetical protein
MNTEFHREDNIDNADNENKWDESEEEYDDDYVQNEVSPPEINQEFSNNILNVKHSLYDNIVLKPEVGTEEAQSSKVLQEYLNRLNDVYVLSLNAQNGNVVNDEKLAKFPEETRKVIKDVLVWIRDYFRKNRVPDTIPYSDYIRKSFRDYQFVQRDSFE